MGRVPWRERFSILRLYMAVLFFGLVLSGFTEAASQKFQQHRLLEMGLWLLVLGWSYRSFRRGIHPAEMGKMYWGGLLTFTAAALIGGFRGATPWISLAFTGSALVQFSLLPWLATAWQRHGEDAVRILALFASCLVGMDVALWIITHVYNFPPYHFIGVQQANGNIQGLGIPYITINSRWANQISVLLLFSYVPLMNQLHRGTITQKEHFWQAIAWSTPAICWSQILVTNGDGGFLAGIAGTSWIIWDAARKEQPNRSFWIRCASASISGFAIALLLSGLLDTAGALSGAAQRNLAELDATGGVRLSHWIFYLQQSLGSPIWGHGIYTVPPGSGICTPHNLWISLTYWTGILGTAAAITMAASFAPDQYKHQWSPSLAPKANGNHLSLWMPMLFALFLYQLVDDIWLRAGALTLMLPMLASLFPPPGQASEKASVEKTGKLARSLALAGLLMIAISISQPQGIGTGNKLIMPEAPSGTSLKGEDQVCLLFL